MIARNKQKPRKAFITLIICALAILAGAFSFPMTVQANPIGNVAPPNVHAEIVGSLLRIEATDGFYPIEAVFINNRRFNFRVDSALLIDISQYIATGDTIAVYAVDFAGNVSNTVLLTPPPPVQPPQPNNLSPEGQGEIVDHATDGDGIEFITINTPAGNTFFLVIDHTRGGNNVYFLNAVTEWDLLTLAADADLPTPPQFTEPPPPPVVIQEAPPQPEPTPEPVEDSEGGNTGMIIFMVIAGAGVFAAAYYFKILKPKQMKEMQGDDDFDDDEDEDDFDEDSEDEDIDGENDSDMLQGDTDAIEDEEKN